MNDSVYIHKQLCGWYIPAFRINLRRQFLSNPQTAARNRMLHLSLRGAACLPIRFSDCWTPNTAALPLGTK